MNKLLLISTLALLPVSASAQKAPVVPPSLPQDIPVVEVPGGAYQNNGAYCKPIAGITIWVAQGGPKIDGAKVAPQKRVGEATIMPPYSYCLSPDCMCFAYKKDSQGKDIPGSRYRKEKLGGGINASEWSASKSSGWTIGGGVSAGASAEASYGQSSETSVTAIIDGFSVAETSVVCGNVRVIQLPLVRDKIRQFQVVRKGVCVPTSTLVGVVTTSPFATDEVAYYSVEKYHFQIAQNRHIPCAKAKKEGLI